MNAMVSARARTIRALRKVDWLAPLVGRLVVGSVFLTTGWGKLHHMPRVIAFFQALGIPSPAFSAHLVAWSELVCGALILLGMLARVATIPLLVTMAVAIAAARAPELHGVLDLLRLTEMTYVAILVYIALDGPGLVSVDAAFWRTLREPRPTLPTAGHGVKGEADAPT